MVILLSLTLRDAQYLSWKTFRRLGQHEQTPSVFGSTEGLMKKAEEITKKIQTDKNLEIKQDLSAMFSELLFTLFVLAEQHDFVLEDSFLTTIDEIILNSVS